MRPHELKLFVIFDAIMVENSITRAAKQLSMTQPAVSNAVSRMRIQWNDELFIPEGRGIKPTTYALNLWAKTRDSLHSLSQAIQPSDFLPNMAKRTFRVALPDIMVDMLWLEMRLLFEQEAPGLNLYAVPYMIAATQNLLENADVDLVIGQSNRSLENICTDHLFDTSYVCVMRKNHPLTKTELNIDQFAAADHLLVSLSGDIANPTDQALHQLGLTRRIAYTVNQFSCAIPIIIGSDLIAVLPTDLIYKYLDNDNISIFRTPLDIPHTSISMLWHKRQNADEGLIWLRKHIKAIAVERRNHYTNEVTQFFDI